MKFKQFKELVNKFGDEYDDLPVCLADWGEQYRSPSESEAHHIKVKTDDYSTETYDTVHGKFICIGNYGFWE